MDARRRVLIALLLAAACLLVFGQTVRFEFLNYDDNAYITGNQWVRSGLTAAGVRWAFGTINFFYWQPLAFVSHMLDCQVYGLQPWGHHLTNVLFHAANAVLVFLLLLELTGAFWRSTAAAAIFALHPLRMESVAWIAERKDLLSAFWFLLAIWCYLRYVRRRSRAGYYLVLGLFVLGLMSKPMVMTLPVVLILLDWWPLKRRRALGEKAPMFALAVLSTFLTSIATGRLGVINWGASLSLWQRVSNALVSYVRYLELSIWPHNLAILYPFRTGMPLWQPASAALLLVVITLAALSQARRRPYLIVGWLWFAVVLAPASGLVQVGRQAFADRFTYLPHVGLILAVVWGVAELLEKHRRTAAALAAGAVILFAGSSLVYLPFWHDSVTVFTRAVAVTGDNPPAQHFLATALEYSGRYAEALPHHAEAVRLDPSYWYAQYIYGIALERQGDLEGASGRFREALRYFPDYPDARKHLEDDQKLLDLSKASGLKLKSER